MEKQSFWNQEVECMALRGLVTLQNQRLLESGTIARGAGLALYKKRWERAGIDPASIVSREDLAALPFTTSAHLKETFLSSSVRNFACEENIRLWFSTSGTTGTPKWIPYADGDIATFQETVLRTYFAFNASSGDTLFMLSTPAPFVSDGLAYFNMLADLAHGLHVEMIPVSINNLMDAVPFCIGSKPEYIMGFPSVLMKVSEELQKQIPTTLQKNYEEAPTLKNLAMKYAARIVKITPKQLFRAKAGAFGGEPLDPYREALHESYGIDSFDLYAFTEFPSACPECTMHDGTHIWIDTTIVELIPDDELKKEAQDPEYTPKTVFLDEAPTGMVGEYVITTFSTAMPLIRYRTSDLMRVVSTGVCGCGRTHPRVKILQRQDDIVNMGLIRFSTYEFDARMKDVSTAGTVKGWQMHVKREGYKPRPTILVQPEGTVNEAAFIAEVRENMLRIDALKTGCEQEMILDPIIAVVDAIDEKRTHTGKLRHVLYEGVD